MNSTLDGSIEEVKLPSKIPADGNLTYTVALDAGLNNISLPLRTVEAFTARSFMDYIDATMVISPTDGKFVSWTRATPGDGFPIEGGRGYIVNTPNRSNITFTGEGWSDALTEAATEPGTAPAPLPSNLWAFVVDGEMEGTGAYRVTLNNLRTDNHLAQTTVESGERLTLGFANLNRKPLVQVGDTLRLTVADTISGEPIGKIDRVVTPEDIRRAYSTLEVILADLPPMTTALLQNYPNPCNPETWIPYQLAETSEVSISIYDVTGQLVRTLQLGN